MKISIKAGWNKKSKLAIIGLIGSIGLVIAVVVF